MSRGPRREWMTQRTATRRKPTRAAKEGLPRGPGENSFGRRVSGYKILLMSKDFKNICKYDDDWCLEISTQSFLNRGTHTELRITQFANICTCSLLPINSLHCDTLWQGITKCFQKSNGVNIFIAYLLQSYGTFTTNFKILSPFSD